ncbi:MAG TPA: alpha/beta hydrolase [Labilithrix sp.]|nr:alpha/beta hydrolase [Labilithrix sp.]
MRYLRRDWDETSGWALPRVRADLDARPFPQAMVRKTTTRDGELGGVPARWFVPPGAKEDRAILFFHGGSFVYGSGKTTHADFVARLALASGVTTIALEYRLAPEHPFPAQLEDAFAAFDALTARATSIVVAGDSAGGNLAIELQIALRDRGRPQAAGAVLLSPWTDLRMPGRSFVDNDPFDYGTRDVLVIHARAFTAGTSLDDPRVSPVHAHLEGLAPAIVIAGEVEIPRDDILTFATRLREAAVDVTLHVAPDMPHNPAVFAAYHPSGQQALEEMAAFVKRVLPEP